MVRKVVFLMLTCCLAGPIWGQPTRAPNVRAEYFSLEQGLADRDIHDILKDRQGYVWIATSKGLSRFDGYDFLTYDSRPRNPHKISLPSIYRLNLDKSGNLLIYYDFPSNDRFDLLNPLTGQLEVLKFDRDLDVVDLVPPFQAPDGTIYILLCQKYGWTVFRFDEGKHRFSALFDLPEATESGYMRINFLKAADGTFWFAFNHFGGDSLVVLHSDSSGKMLQTFRLPDVDANKVDVSDCSYAFLTEPAAGQIWVALVYDGVQALDPRRTNAFERHPLLTQGNLAFSKDAAGNLLVYQQNAKSPIKQCLLLAADGSSQDYSWLFGHQAMIYEPFSEDFTRGLFAGSRDGLYKYWLPPGRFTAFLNKDLGNAPFGISGRGIAKVGKETLVIGTENDGVFEMNLATGQLTRPGDRAPQLKPLDDFLLIRGILSQGDSVCWISGRAGLLKYRPAQNKVTFYETDRYEIWGLAMDKQGKIWTASFDGTLLQVDPATGRFTEYTNKDGSRPLEGSQPMYLIIGHDGILWAGTTLAGLIRIDPVRRESRRFTADPGDPAGFNSNQIACIYEDEAGLLWIGTLEGGLQVFDPRKEHVIAVYTREDGLPYNSIASILPDGHGNYWLSTFNGLSFFDARSKTFRNYSTADGLSHNEFNRHSSFYDRENGRFYFGGLNGVNTFNEKDMRPQENHLPLMLSEVALPAQNDSVMVRYEGIADGSTLVLPPGKGFLHLRFALADYSNPAANQFSYKLEGLDKDWNYLGSDHDLRLDHLPAGSYTLRLRGADNQGNWSSREIALHLQVKTFWYNRWWAWLLYALILALGGWYFYRFQLRRKIAEKEAHRLQELDSFKSRFFTNITHEFRTPLTVILGTTDQLAAEGAFPTPLPKNRDQGNGAATADWKARLRLIKRNGESLLRLINQILDLAKLESNSLKMNYVQGDVLPYLRYIAESLHTLANAQNVLLRVESTEREIILDYDPERLLQITHNLLSNAIKFTPSGGRVVLRTTIDSKRLTTDGPGGTGNRQPWIVLSVIDTGAGIPPEDLPFIFDRFYQANNLEKASAGGTGIGLALTKELIQQMGGAIQMESAPGKGTTVTATWPITRKAAPPTASLPLFDPAALGIPSSPASSSSAPIRSGRLSETAFARPETEAVRAPAFILLIEDNPDVVTYLTACLEQGDRESRPYALDFAYNGRAGIEKALETVPDLIVSDVMMPEKDGFEVCDFLKNDERTSHIPIILLTAKADIESRIAGLRHGADAYLAKPFHQEELLLTVANALESRKKLQVRFANAAAGPLTPPEASPDVEDAFVHKVRAAVEGHLSDASFSVDQLCRALAMSQPQLHRKLTALTGKNATLFMRAIRLEKAKALLLQKGKTVSEVAFECGFDDPKYFSRVFTEAFGVAPSRV